jgi:hypothetical protein
VQYLRSPQDIAIAKMVPESRKSKLSFGITKTFDITFGFNEAMDIWIEQILVHHAADIITPSQLDGSTRTEWARRIVGNAVRSNIISWSEELWQDEPTIVCLEQGLVLSRNCLESIKTATASFCRSAFSIIMKLLRQQAPNCKVRR